MTLRTFCLIAAISLAIPQVSLGQDRHEIFTTLSDMDVPYRIPAIAALQDLSLIHI